MDAKYLISIFLNEEFMGTWKSSKIPTDESIITLVCESQDMDPGTIGEPESSREDIYDTYTFDAVDDEIVVIITTPGQLPEM